MVSKNLCVSLSIRRDKLECLNNILNSTLIEFAQFEVDKHDFYTHKGNLLRYKLTLLPCFHIECTQSLTTHQIEQYLINICI